MIADQLQFPTMKQGETVKNFPSLKAAKAQLLVQHVESGQSPQGALLKSSINAALFMLSKF